MHKYDALGFLYSFWRPNQWECLSIFTSNWIKFWAFREYDPFNFNQNLMKKYFYYTYIVYMNILDILKKTKPRRSWGIRSECYLISKDINQRLPQRNDTLQLRKVSDYALSGWCPIRPSEQNFSPWGSCHAPLHSGHSGGCYFKP